jgi:4-oxalocrotonate tautomerase
MLEGRTAEQKRALVKEMTEIVVKTINTQAKEVKIILHDMAKQDYASEGFLYSDK